MREYARIQRQDKPQSMPEKKPKKAIQAEPDFEIGQHDLTDEYTIL